jgi:hypothetical protein
VDWDAAQAAIEEAFLFHRPPSSPPPFGCFRFGIGKREPNVKPTAIRSDANGGRRCRRKEQDDAPFRYSLRTGAWHWEHSKAWGACPFLLSAKARRLPVLLSHGRSSSPSRPAPSRQQAYRTTSSLSLLLPQRW